MLAGKFTPDPGGNGGICRCVTNRLPEAATGAQRNQLARSLGGSERNAPKMLLLNLGAQAGRLHLHDM